MGPVLEPVLDGWPPSVDGWLVPVSVPHGPAPCLSQAAGWGAIWARWFSDRWPATNVGL